MSVLGTDWSLARRLVPVFGGNPLVLRLLSKFVRENSTEVEALILDGQQRRSDGAPVGEIGVRFVYRRILNRISNARVKALAYPGIALRRVTPQIIRDVLGRVVGGDDLVVETIHDANQLFNELAQHVWLVRRLNDSTVEHRPDTRRLMVPALQTDPDIDIEALHRAAAAFWARRAAHELVPGEAFVEMNYHLGFLDRLDPSMTAEEAQLLKRRLGADLQLWPNPRPRALVKAIGGFALEMTEEEVEDLDARFVMDARVERLEQRIWRGSESAIGYETNAARNQLGFALDDDDGRIQVDALELQLAFRDSRFDFLTRPERALHGIEEFMMDSRSAESSSCLLYTSPSPRDATLSRMPSSA